MAARSGPVRPGWAGDFAPGLVKLIRPGAFSVATWLVPAAAIGPAMLMVGAVVTHLRRGEYPNAVVNLVLLAVAVFVATERIGPERF